MPGAFDIYIGVCDDFHSSVGGFRWRGFDGEVFIDFCDLLTFEVCWIVWGVFGEFCGKSKGKRGVDC
jgi:hypothetical protein